MLENLRIAVRKQRRLLLIFFLTIFLPALTLSVFGVRAIRSERFRLAKQEETEARRAAVAIRTYIQSKLETIGRALAATARDPAFITGDLVAISKAAEKRFAADPLAGQAVLIYRNETAWFPLLQASPRKRAASAPSAADATLAQGIRRAEALEFVDRDFRAAAEFYGARLHRARAIRHDALGWRSAAREAGQGAVAPRNGSNAIHSG